MSQPGAVAALDCGTNSTRLLVADPAGHALSREMRITRLGQGVDARRRLDPDAIDRTLDALRAFRAIMDDHRVGRARLAATSAVRDAANGEDFLRAAADVTGVEAELLSGREEGRLSYAGATAGLPAGEGPVLVLDIGGGSTELVTPVGDEVTLGVHGHRLRPADGALPARRPADARTGEGCRHGHRRRARLGGR